MMIPWVSSKSLIAGPLASESRWKMAACSSRVHQYNVASS